MRLVLSGRSSLAALLTSYHLNSTRISDMRILRDCNPTQASLDFLADALPQLPRPYELLVPTWRRHPKGSAIRSSTYHYSTGSFIQVNHGVFASSPELCFVQLGIESGLHEHIFMGNALCGSFVIDPLAHGGLGEKRPFTSVKKIEQFIARNCQLPGTAQAKKVLPFIVEGCASPPEIFLQMVCLLPPYLGGYNLPRGKVNKPLGASSRTRTISGRQRVIPDCYWPEHQLALEYDSNAEHHTGSQLSRDSTKRLALEARGYRVITVTNEQLFSQAHMRNVCREIARCCQVRIRIRDKRFHAAQNQLFRSSHCLNSLFSPQWLHPE